MTAPPTVPAVLRETTVDDPTVPRYEIPGWRERFGLVAGITGRGTGSEGFDLGIAGERPVGTVTDRWFRLLERFQPGFAGVMLNRQVHGTSLVTHRARQSGWVVGRGVDGQLTSQTGVLLAVTVADCIPVYLAAPVTGGVGLLHAGWKGIAAGILEAALRKFATDFDTAPQGLVAHFGVGICGECYQVGRDVAERLGVAVPESESGVTTADLRAVLALRARTAGVPVVTVSPWCSLHDEPFYSYRGEGEAAGRMAAYLGRPSP